MSKYAVLVLLGTAYCGGTMKNTPVDPKPIIFFLMAAKVIQFFYKTSSYTSSEPIKFETNTPEESINFTSNPHIEEIPLPDSNIENMMSFTNNTSSNITSNIANNIASNITSNQSGSDPSVLDLSGEYKNSMSLIDLDAIKKIFRTIIDLFTKSAFGLLIQRIWSYLSDSFANLMAQGLIYFQILQKYFSELIDQLSKILTRLWNAKLFSLEGLFAVVLMACLCSIVYLTFTWIRKVYRELMKPSKAPKKVDLNLELDDSHYAEDSINI